MLTLYFKGRRLMQMSRNQLPFHTPARGEHPWKIVDDETGEVVACYSPPRVGRPKVITEYAGSWAELMKEK